eukprot:1318516-Amphidinium_carterae.1
MAWRASWSELLRRWRQKTCTVTRNQVSVFKNHDVEYFSGYCRIVFVAVALESKMEEMTFEVVRDAWVKAFCVILVWPLVL